MGVEAGTKEEKGAPGCICTSACVVAVYGGGDQLLLFLRGRGGAGLFACMSAWRQGLRRM